MDTVYIETSILSHATARRSSDPAVAVLQDQAKRWWDEQRLLTQNCKHIANAHVLPRVYDLLAELGYSRSLICTPAEFLGDPDDGPQSDS